MRKILFFTIILSLISAYSIGAFAEGPVELEFSNEETDTGCTVTLDAQNLTKIAMMQFNVIYDASQLSCKSAAAGTALTGNVGPTINTSTPGCIVFIWDSLRTIKSDGSLLIIEFERIGTGDAAVQIDTDGTVIFAYDDFTQPGVNCEPLILKGTEPEATPVTTVTTETAETTESKESAESGIAATASPKTAATASPAASEKPAATVAAASPKLTEGTNGEGLTLSSNSQQLTTGQTTQITVTENSTAVYTSSNESVATVDESGNVTAVGEGTAVITVTNEEGTSFSTCNVAVEASDNPESATIESISTDNLQSVKNNDSSVSDDSDSSAIPYVIIAIAAVALAVAAVIFIKKKKPNNTDKTEIN